MADESALKWYLVHEVILDRLYDTETFFSALKIWIERPQVLNRRLTGSYALQLFQTTKYKDLLGTIDVLSDESGPISREKLLQLQRNFENVTPDSTNVEENALVVRIRRLLPRQSSRYKNVLEVIIQDIRNRSIAFIPFEEDQAIDQVIPKIEHAYKVSLNENVHNSQSLTLSVLNQEATADGVTCPTVEWLKSYLLPKLHKWMQDDGTNFKSFGSSLRLVPVDRYTEKYEELKKKYKHFVKMWPERTDPHKFVYEDVAIATYLLLLWEDEQDCEGKMEKVQTFVDLGCGNGLLVHILTNEGHLGKGIDLRSRKVWQFYDSKTDLQVTTLDPSSLTYPDVDWIIGNHSDELTPWIPVIATRSSYTCKYFVLPCCFHDFYSKFQRGSANDSQYRSYLNYVQSIGQTCGFEVKEDVLRIPSTKKVCQIGQSRMYPPERQHFIEQNVSEMLHRTKTHNMKDKDRIYDAENKHRTYLEIHVPSTEEGNPSCNQHTTETLQMPQELQALLKHSETVKKVSTSTLLDNHRCDIASQQSKSHGFENQFSTYQEGSYNDKTSCEHASGISKLPPQSFVPRPSKEPVKNCTQLDKNLLQIIVQRVATELLSRSTDEKPSDIRKEENIKIWNKGGRIKLSEVSAMFDQKILSELRSEAGGIQTVLRNFHQVFKVQDGMVEIRDWREESHAQTDNIKKDGKKKRQNGSRRYWKTKQCWFHINHPDGCPLIADQCSFAHGTEDTITLPTKQNKQITNKNDQITF